MAALLPSFSSKAPSPLLLPCLVSHYSSVTSLAPTPSTIFTEWGTGTFIKIDMVCTTQHLHNIQLCNGFGSILCWLKIYIWANPGERPLLLSIAKRICENKQIKSTWTGIGTKNIIDHLFTDSVVISQASVPLNTVFPWVKPPREPRQHEDDEAKGRCSLGGNSITPSRFNSNFTTIALRCLCLRQEPIHFSSDINWFIEV